MDIYVNYQEADYQLNQINMEAILHCFKTMLQL